LDGNYIVIIGLDGYCMLLSTSTKRWVGNVKMNSTAVSVAFTPGYIWTLSQDGEIYKWDLQTRHCIHRFVDQGNVRATTMAISDDFSWLAVGSTSGIVNLYNVNAIGENEAPVPVKVFMNLTTSVSSIVFHPSSQILAIASKEVKDSLRLINVTSRTVFQNWPTGKTPLRYVYSVAFSPSGKYIAIGNDNGKVLLYQLDCFQ
jgi:U3 small nucleolar RNA-associated protein 18